MAQTTLDNLACTNSEFRMWISAMTSNPDPCRHLTLIVDADKFKQYLTECEIVRLNDFLMYGGPPPEWMKKSHQSQSQAEKIIQKTQRTVAALGGMTVMCNACGIKQPMGTKCFKNGTYHMYEDPIPEKKRNEMTVMLKLMAEEEMTVMCDACGSPQPMGTKCLKTGAYHM